MSRDRSPSPRTRRRLAAGGCDVLEVGLHVGLGAGVALRLADGQGAEVAVAVGRERSVTVTLVRVTSPVLVTVILNVAVPPIAIDCDFGSLTMSIAGFDTGGFGTTAGGTVTLTGAESFAVTVWPFEPVPVAVATLVKFAVTLPSEQL